MSDCNGLTLRRVRYMIRHTVFTERKKKSSLRSKPGNLTYLDMH